MFVKKIKCEFEGYTFGCFTQGKHWLVDSKNPVKNFNPTRFLGDVLNAQVVNETVKLDKRIIVKIFNFVLNEPIFCHCS